MIWWQWVFAIIFLWDFIYDIYLYCVSICIFVNGENTSWLAYCSCVVKLQLVNVKIFQKVKIPLQMSSTVSGLKAEWIFFFFLTSLLEYNCFTMVCQFLLYNKVNQLYIHICPHISSLLHLPPSHPPYPTPLGGHKARSWSPCAMRLLPTSYLFYVW